MDSVQLESHAMSDWAQLKGDDVCSFVAAMLLCSFNRRGYRKTLFTKLDKNYCHYLFKYQSKQMLKDKEVYGSNDTPRSDLPSHESTSLSGYTGTPAK